MDKNSDSDVCEAFFMRDMSDEEALKFLENDFELHFSGLELLILTGICVDESKCLECFADVHKKLARQVIAQCLFNDIDSPFDLGMLTTGSLKRKRG
jgi:hypothetical protein